jgi:hypothetical protein
MEEKYILNQQDGLLYKILEDLKQVQFLDTELSKPNPEATEKIAEALACIEVASQRKKNAWIKAAKE